MPLQLGAVSTENKVTPQTPDEPAASDNGSAQLTDSSGKESARETAPETPVQPSQTAAEPVVAVRSFRDALKGGIKGPVMMELPAGNLKN